MSVIALLAASPGSFHRHLPGARTRRRQLSQRRDLPPAHHARAPVARAVCARLCRRGSGRSTTDARAGAASASISSCRARPARPARRPITALQNIPLISWLAPARDAAPAAAQRISVRYPLVELPHGQCCSAAVAWQFGFGWPALAALLLHLVPDRAHLHRRRSSAAARTRLTLPLLWVRPVRQPVRPHGRRRRGCPGRRCARA